MIVLHKHIGMNGLITAGLALALVAAVGRIHLRVQTTLIGYGIAELKEQESKLLEERSLLKVQLSKLTTKKHLILMTETIEGPGGSRPSVASK